MKIVSTSYAVTNAYVEPKSWLNRIRGYAGILEALGRNHDVLSVERINYEGEQVENGVRYYFLKHKTDTIYFPNKMHKLISRWGPDVVLVNGFIFPLQIIQLRLRIGSKPKIIVLHRAEHPFKGMKRILQQWADRAVDGYLFSSTDFGNQWMRSGIIRNPDKVFEVIQASSAFTPMDKSIAKEKIGRNGNPLFLWVGRLDANKDPVTAVKGFLKYQGKNPGAHLLMVYQREDLINEVRKIIGDNSSITLIGKVGHSKMEDYYNAADFIISSSHYEGGGVAVSEAMSCGCIPILTNIPSFRAMTGEGICGFLYKAGNENALAEALSKVGNLDRSIEKEKVLKLFKEKLSFEAIARSIEHTISAINNKR